MFPAKHTALSHIAGAKGYCHVVEQLPKPKRGQIVGLIFLSKPQGRIVLHGLLHEKRNCLGRLSITHKLNSDHDS
jgi:hypothetical protein